MAKSPLSVPVPVPADPTRCEDERRLWIGNLDTRVTEFSLLKMLQKLGTLEKFDFLYHKSGPDQGKSRGYCFVTYSTHEEAERAMVKLNGKQALTRRMAVRWAFREEDHGASRAASKSNDEQANATSTDAKIRAIESKLRNMERSEKDFTLSLNPSAPPGSSKYSVVKSGDANKLKARDNKPYRRDTNRR